MDGLLEEGALDLLKWLIMDNVPSVSQSAALALGRLAGNSVLVSDDLVSEPEIVKHLIDNLSSKNPFDQRVAAYVIHAMAKHNEKIATELILADNPRSV